MLNKQFSQRLASVFLPIVMPMMDRAFCDVKRELLKSLHGRVLDVGCGTGDWLKYFGKANHITELEPNPFMLPKIAKNVREFKKINPDVEVVVVNNFANELDLNQPYDYIVFGNVMCEVHDQESFLKDIDRILKPGGKIVFMEHIRYPDETFLGWFQDIFNLWWVTASDGCNCNRRTVDTIRKIPGWNIACWDLYHDGPVFLSRMALGIIEKRV
jgi:SAM-dependent methyltransferase